MKTRTTAEWFVLALSVSAMLMIVSTTVRAQGLGTGGVNVLTWHNDTYRTGDNLSESTLTYNTLSDTTFGQRCSAALDGQVYAQPLVVPNVTIGGTTYNYVVYVVTQNDTLYAIDGDPNDNPPCEILNGGGNGTSLLFGHYPANCGDIGDKQCDPLRGDPIVPSVGIMGTPVINISGSTGTIYLVAETGNKPSGATEWYHYLYAVDIQSFAVTNSVQICKGGCGKYTTSTDFSEHHIQRPGLLFANCGAGCGNKNYVYVAMSMMDATGYPFANGTVFGYDAAALSTGTVFYFQASDGHRESGSNGGGIWMGGAAPAFGPDANGKNWIYVTTANGTFDLSTGGSNAGDSFLKLDPYRLTLTGDNTGYFTPADQFYRSDQTCKQVNGGGDIDFNPGGPMLIPDNELTNWPHLAVSGDKEGGLWFVDRTNPNGFTNVACGNNCACQQPSSNVQTYWTGTPYTGTTIHGGMAYWEYDAVVPLLNYMYAAAGGGQLNRYPLCADPRATKPIDLTTCASSVVGSVNSQGQAITFPFGTTPSVSANGQGASDAVVWTMQKPDGNAPEGTTRGVLYAFDAVSMTELYDSNMCLMNGVKVDQIAPATKFSVPTVANSYVYVGAEELQNNSNNGTGTFYIFGPLSNRTCN